ncbi:MAG: nitrophenyl compound nitroreductase subunit ArsF family protein [Candidatus Cryptobacteroides sp.]
MRRILCFIASLAVIVSCGNGNNKKAAAEADGNIQKNRVEVLVFYGAKRCATCRAIETQSKELVDSSFAEELASGLLVFRTVDMTTPEGEALADSYEVASSSLLIVQHLDGKESVNNLTRFAFTTARNKPDEFREGLRKEVRSMLDATPQQTCCSINSEK